MKQLLSICALVSVVAASAQAQVGSIPEASPFADLDRHLSVTAFSGYYNGGRDPVGVSGGNGALLGLRLDWWLAGVANLTGRVATASLSRNVLDPTRTGDDVVIGERDYSLYLADLAFTFGLTGGKTVHNLAPFLAVGVGVTTDFDSRDAGGYRMGTSFLLSLGAGTRWILSDAWELRGDITQYMYAIPYPATYQVAPEGGVALRRGDLSAYTQNIALSLGLSFRLLR